MISAMEMLLLIVVVTAVTGIAWAALDLAEVVERRRAARTHPRPAGRDLRHREEVRS